MDLDRKSYANRPPVRIDLSQLPACRSPQAGSYKKNAPARGQVLEIGVIWYAIGIIATIVGSGTIKFLAIFVLGGSAVMNPSQNLKTFFLSIVPILSAFAASIYIKSHAYKSMGKTERIQDDIGAGKYK